MLNEKMIKNDLKGIFANSNALIFTDDLNNKPLPAHFNRYTRVIFDDGTSGTQITALILNDEPSQNLRIRQKITIQDEIFYIFKIELESQHLKRLVLTKGPTNAKG